MIRIKSKADILKMKASAEILKNLLLYLEEITEVGITTKELDRKAREFIKKHKGIPSFLGYGGFPATICTSINEQVVHGIPSDRELKDGDIISVDGGVILDEWHSDAARTFLVGNVDERVKKLVEDTKQSFFEGVKAFKEGNHIGDIGHAIQTYWESRGYGVVKEMVGHGIGKDLHEDPSVPNYGKPGFGKRIQVGMTLAIEPMITLGTDRIVIYKDGWTCTTADGSICAHYENTCALTENGVEILIL